MVAELLYLEKQGGSLPIEMLINSSGTTRQDGEIVSAIWESDLGMRSRNAIWARLEMQLTTSAPGAGGPPLRKRHAQDAAPRAQRVPAARRPPCSPARTLPRPLASPPSSQKPQLAFDSEGIALTSTMGFVRNPVSN